MSNKQLLSFIKKNIKKGVSREKIINVLVDEGGWGRLDVANAFKEIDNETLGITPEMIENSKKPFAKKKSKTKTEDYKLGPRFISIFLRLLQLCSLGALVFSLFPEILPSQYQAYIGLSMTINVFAAPLLAILGFLDAKALRRRGRLGSTRFANFLSWAILAFDVYFVIDIIGLEALKTIITRPFK